MTHTDLLACPFCGCKPKVYEGDYASSVKCDNGHAIHVYGPAISTAITAWNTRTPDTAPSQSGDLIAEVNAAWNAMDDCAKFVPDLITALRAAEAREQKLREALTFYADRHRWRSVTAPMCGCVGESSATNDSGGRARRALGGGND